jgi:hypothetical protein
MQEMAEESLAYLGNAWDNRELYSHESYLHLEEVQTAVALQN